MILHVLPGDATVADFKATGIEGEIAVCRECLVDGDVSGSTLQEFWQKRARFLATEYADGNGDYADVVSEFEKLQVPQTGSEINLWFEYELFCQTNMWFCLSLLGQTGADIFRVAPVVLPEERAWDGFARLAAQDLKKCFDDRVKLSQSDIALGMSLWSAYRSGDRTALEELSLTESPAFPKLREVCLAAIAKDSRPKEIISKIVEGGENDFSQIFREFRSRAGEYGYGDLQVKKIWQSLLV